MNEDLEVGDTAEMVFENLDRIDLVKYAGASGDFNPIHFDDTYAESAGYPSVFGQGMYTAALVSNLVDDWFGVERIEQFGTRFVGQTWPGDDVVVTGEVIDLDSYGDTTVAEVELVATNDDGDDLVQGSATVRL